MRDPDRTCFVISPIGTPESATRNRADLVFEFVIAEALSTLNFKIERADKLAEPGIITNQIIERVINSDLVVADLSERNPNVFYELALRHVARKPCIHLIAHDEDIPFDNAGARAIKVDVGDLRSVRDAKAELLRQVESTMRDGAVVENPISVALRLQYLKESGDQEKLAISSLSDQISDLKRGMSELASAVTISNHKARYQNALAGISADSLATFGHGGGAPKQGSALTAKSIVADQIANALNDVVHGGAADALAPLPAGIGSKRRKALF